MTGNELAGMPMKRCILNLPTRAKSNGDGILVRAYRAFFQFLRHTFGDNLDPTYWLTERECGDMVEYSYDDEDIEGWRDLCWRRKNMARAAVVLLACVIGAALCVGIAWVTQ